MASKRHRGEGSSTFRFNPPPLVRLPIHKARHRVGNVCFTSSAEKNKYVELMRKDFDTTKFFDLPTMMEMGIEDDIEKLSQRFGFTITSKLAYSYKSLTCEFLATLVANLQDNSPHISFQILNQRFELSLATVAEYLGIPHYHGLRSSAPKSNASTSARAAFWTKITRKEGRYEARTASNYDVLNPVFRYFLRSYSNILVATPEGYHHVGAIACHSLMEVMNNEPLSIDPTKATIAQLLKIASSPPSKICGGGLVTLIAQGLGMRDEPEERVSHQITIDHTYIQKSFMFRTVEGVNRLYYLITPLRAMAVPNEPHTTIFKTENWGMPLRDGELTRNSQHERWKVTTYGLDPSTIRYERPLPDEEGYIEDLDDDDEDEFGDDDDEDDDGNDPTPGRPSQGQGISAQPGIRFRPTHAPNPYHNQFAAGGSMGAGSSMGAGGQFGYGYNPYAPQQPYMHQPFPQQPPPPDYTQAPWGIPNLIQDVETLTTNYGRLSLSFDAFRTDTRRSFEEFREETRKSFEDLAGTSQRTADAVAKIETSWNSFFKDFNDRYQHPPPQ